MNAIVMLAVSAAVSGGSVKVSDFGYDAADSTEYIRAALTSGARRVTLDRQSGPWYTLPLKMPSNVELVLEPGVELVAKRGEYKGLRDYLLELPYCTNVVVRGGAGSTLRMWKRDYQGPDYKHGEWRYALRIHNAVNVLIDGLRIEESGGDGIGVTGEDITIRNCVCDRNHRQGMSIFSVKNLLVENCVFSNTSGTPPQAGVDIEPDSAKERLENIVFRNCAAYGNAGNGFEMYLVQLKKSSGPVSITYENCRTWGNARNDTTLSCRHKLDGDAVSGLVRYVNCVFGPSNGNVSLSSIPAGAVDVEFRDTVITNAPGHPAVRVHVADPQQGRPDGIDFGNLTIVGASAENWFACSGEGVGAVKAVRGDVRIVGPDGSRGRVAIDDAWIAKNIPVFDDGRPLPPRRGAPDASTVKALDEAPGELVDVAPVTLLDKTPIVFFADKPGICRFVARQVITVKGRPPSDKPLTIEPVSGGRKTKVHVPGTAPVEISYRAAKRGFYRISVPKWGSRLRIDRTSEPLAIDASGGKTLFAPFGVKSFELSFDADGSPWALVAYGSDYYRFSAAVNDPSGVVCKSSDLVSNMFVARGEGKCGFHTVVFGRAAKPHFDFIRLSLYGARGFLFLSPRKRWLCATP